MKLNLFTIYAVRTLMYLCWHPGRTITASEVSRFYAISHDHVVKVVQELGRRGYVHSRRGRGGGTTLACNPNEVSLADLLVAFEGPIALVDSLRSADDQEDPTCRLTAALGEGQRLMMDHFASVTLQDLAGDKAPPSNLQSNGDGLENDNGNGNGTGPVNSNQPTESSSPNFV